MIVKNYAVYFVKIFLIRYMSLKILENLHPDIKTVHRGCKKRQK